MMLAPASRLASKNCATTMTGLMNAGHLFHRGAEADGPRDRPGDRHHDLSHGPLDAGKRKRRAGCGKR